MLSFFTGRPGWSEGLFILVVVLLIFGPKQLPVFARYLARMVGELKKGKDEFMDELNKNDENVDKKDESE